MFCCRISVLGIRTEGTFTPTVFVSMRHALFSFCFLRLVVSIWNNNNSKQRKHVSGASFIVFIRNIISINLIYWISSTCRFYLFTFPDRLHNTNNAIALVYRRWQRHYIAYIPNASSLGVSSYAPAFPNGLPSIYHVRDIISKHCLRKQLIIVVWHSPPL